jgi:purine-nucleoside phosphorylase
MMKKSQCRDGQIFSGGGLLPAHRNWRLTETDGLPKLLFLFERQSANPEPRAIACADTADGLVVIQEDGMQLNRTHVREATEFIRRCVGAAPVQAGLLTGTGLGRLTDFLEESREISYRRIPHFPVSTVPSHSGALVVGTWQGRRVAALQGRFHLYEGYEPREVTFPIRVMQELGVQVLVLTNAAGGLNPDFASGDIMVIKDHINLTGENPLVGPNEERWGPRFPDMSAAYDGKLAQDVLRSAGRRKVALQQGVYVGLTGPSLETPAEVRFLRTIGADAVGFSTVQEAIAAVHANMRVVGLSTITNVHDPDRPAPADLQDIIDCAARAVPVLQGLVRDLIGGLDVQG